MRGQSGIACAFIAAAVVAAGATLPAKAQTNSIPTTGTLTVTAKLVQGCGVVGGGSGTNLNFGTIDFGQVPAVTQGVREGVSASGTFQIQCSPNVVLKVSVDNGGHPSNGGNQRNLAGPGGALIPYRLFMDQAKTKPFNVGSPINTTVSGALSLPIYGELTLSGGPKQPGAYTDIAQVTLSY